MYHYIYDRNITSIIKLIISYEHIVTHSPIGAIYSTPIPREPVQSRVYTYEHVHCIHDYLNNVYLNLQMDSNVCLKKICLKGGSGRKSACGQKRLSDQICGSEGLTRNCANAWPYLLSCITYAYAWSD